MWTIKPKKGFLWRTIGWYVGWENSSGFGPVTEYKTYDEATAHVKQLEGFNEIKRPAHTFDFRSGKTGWGHVMHTSTWRVVDDTQVEVMVHCSPLPYEGDRVLMTGKSGQDWNVKIAKVEPCYDPRDMYTLTLEDDSEPT